ncbi:unnamed protein product [Miscanthus lutarioriparius]|uniref:AMP-dependent synthetase/ligase domain-containing protein n=1 Tax=Miscanthus lutarioriparius TaxID=422564 RepID=A0A811MGM9_9POAL|nr:unnamed protein product [Miscanthus lutarioriparius]
MRPAVPIQSDPALSLNDLIFRHADACPSAFALVDADTGSAFTFAGLRSAALTAASALSARAGVAELRLPAILLDGDAAASVIVPSGANVTLYSDLVDGVQETEYRRPPTKRSDTPPLLYSSGTTGERKGVVLTHGNFIAAHAMLASDPDARAGRGKTCSLCFLPMFHLFGLSVVTLRQLQRGNAVVVMPRFDMDAAMAAVGSGTASRTSTASRR